MVKICRRQSCNYSLYTNTYSSLIQMDTTYTWHGNYLDQGRTGVCTQIIITTWKCTYFNHFKKTIISLFYQHHITSVYTILTKTCKVQHCWHHNIPMFIVTRFVAVCFKEILVSAVWRWRGNRAETCRSYVEDCTYKLTL